MAQETPTENSTVRIPTALAVGELAEILNISAIDIIKELMKNGVMANVNQVIDFDTAAIVATDLGFELEEETEEWNFCMDEADHQTMVRREMARIRKEWKAKGLKEEGVTDVHKIVHEAERRVSQMAKKDINKYKKDSHELIGGNDE